MGNPVEQDSNNVRERGGEKRRDEKEDYANGKQLPLFEGVFEELLIHRPRKLLSLSGNNRITPLELKFPLASRLTTTRLFVVRL